MARILSDAQLSALLETYVKEGSKAARELGVSFGVRPQYVRKLCAKHKVIKPRCILSKAQLKAILDVYSTEGTLAARDLAPTFGIKESYVRQLGSKHGVKAYKAPKKKIIPNGKWEDPRWEWAKQRGALIA